jgi:crotonobetainyl-CoA:carnitine CoA-transferase CaiB-like acyl-CoA transferase
MAGPLDGVKVLDFTHVYAGPFCTLLLRDLGADVIKVEKVEGGDTVRNDAPHTEGMESGIFINLNRGKKGVTLNLNSAKGKEIAKSIVKKVDIVVENFSYGTMEKLGLDYEALSKINPQLIYASISGYGRSGPRRDDPGYDPVIQASAGMTSITGFKDQPVKCGAAIADFGAGLYTALAITSAYVHRLKTGEGQQIDMSLQDCTWLFASLEFSPLYFLKGIVPERTGNGHPIMTPGSLYKAKDGAVIIATGNLGQVKRLFNLIGGDELVNSPMCAPQALRITYKEQIDKVVEEWTQQYTQEEIVQQLKDINIACAKVPTYDQVCTDPHLIERKMIIDIEQLVSGKVRVPGSPFKLSKTPGDIAFPAPFHGEHNMDIYSELLGLSEAEIDDLSNNGII